MRNYGTDVKTAGTVCEEAQAMRESERRYRRWRRARRLRRLAPWLFWVGMALAIYWMVKLFLLMRELF